jgi:hypothetical protein
VGLVYDPRGLLGVTTARPGVPRVLQGPRPLVTASLAIMILIHFAKVAPYTHE